MYRGVTTDKLLIASGYNGGLCFFSANYGLLMTTFFPCTLHSFLSPSSSATMPTRAEFWVGGKGSSCMVAIAALISQLHSLRCGHRKAHHLTDPIHSQGLALAVGADALYRIFLGWLRTSLGVRQGVDNALFTTVSEGHAWMSEGCLGGELDWVGGVQRRAGAEG